MSQHEEQDRRRDESEELYQPQNPEEAPHVEPGPGGYEDRDPKTDMPRIPSAPETQDEQESPPG